MTALSTLRQYGLFLFGLIWIITSCEDKHQERYDDPPWLGGSNIETLEDLTAEGEESYNYFLELMDSAGYRDPIAKQLFTLFVPNDSAFEEYFKTAGITGIKDLTTTQALELFTLHILRNPLSRYYLIYEYKFGEEQGPDGEYASLFVRKITNSYPAIYYDSVRYYDRYEGEVLPIYGNERLLSVISSEYMNDINGAPDGSDYTFMCPKTTYTGLQWHNTAVIKPEYPTSSGFIYFIDRVVAPPPSIEHYMKRNQDTYGVFYDLMQHFAVYGSPRTEDVGEEKVVQYQKGYEIISDVANEYGPVTSADHRQRDVFSAFIPQNDVMQEYIDNKLLASFPAIDSVPQVTMYYLLQSHLATNLQLASKISKDFFNPFGDLIQIDTDNDISNAFLCSNGPVYTMSKVLEPNAFLSVPGPVFFRDNYTTFLYALAISGRIASLSQPEVDVTLFAPDDDAMLDYGIRFDREELELQILIKGRWEQMEFEDIDLFVQDHIVFGKIENLSQTGFLEMSSGNFIKYDGSVLVAGGNVEDNDQANIDEEIESEINGILYMLDNALKTPKRTMAKFVMDDPELSDFLELVNSVETEDLITQGVDIQTEDTIYTFNFAGESDSWTAFIPTNDALASYTIPEGVDTIDFIRYHFVQGAIFDDGNLSGMFETAKIDTITEDEGIIYSEVSISNSPNALAITDKTGQEITVPHATANNIVQKAVVHKINGVLRLEE